MKCPDGWELKSRECWGGERLVRGIWSVWKTDAGEWAAKEEGKPALVSFLTMDEAIEHAETS